ncbi:MAG: hypothetical protein ACTSRI_20065 [Promethearchaeota archaeon]
MNEEGKNFDEWKKKYLPLEKRYHEIGNYLDLVLKSILIKFCQKKNYDAEQELKVTLSS